MTVPSPLDDLVMLGAGGHAKVLQALAVAAGRHWLGVCDPVLARGGEREWRGLPVLGGDDALERLHPATALVNGVGQTVGDARRRRLYEECRGKGFRFPLLVHPAAWMAADTAAEDGVQVMAGAVVQPGCSIGGNSIVNTRASIDHDCRLGAHVHIAPGATLCGGVHVGDGAFIGAGAVVLPGVRIGAGAIVAAGATASRDLAAGAMLPRPRAPHSCVLREDQRS